MGNSYSLDLRERIVALVDAEHSCCSAVRYFGVGDSTAIRLVSRRKRTGSISRPPQGRPRSHGKLAGYRSF